MTKNRIEEIAHEVMQALLHHEILDKSSAKPAGEACEGQVECLVNQRIDSKKSRVTVATLALNFKTLEDYDHAILNREQRRQRANDNRINVIRNMLTTSIAEEFTEGANEMLDPFTLINETFDLKDFACVYSGLLQREDKMSSYSEVFGSIPDAPADSVIGELFTKAFDIMKDKGLMEEWNALKGMVAVPSPVASEPLQPG